MSSAVLPVPHSFPEYSEPERPHLRPVESDLTRADEQSNVVPLRPTGVPTAPTHRIVGTIAIYAFEAVEGIRHVGQLARWISPAVTEHLSEHRALTHERRSLYRDVRRHVPNVRKVRTSSPRAGVIEGTVILDVSGRCRAVAIRLEIVRRRWQATSITIL